MTVFLKGKFVKSLDGALLYYECTGKKPSLLLCDGMLCQGHIWKYFASAMSGERECLHWHYPGHGRSNDPPVGASLSPEKLADNAAIVIRDTGVKRVTVVGHSLGVQVALELWRRHRDLVDALILICGSPGNIVDGFHEGKTLRYLLPLLDMFAKFIPNRMIKLWKTIPTDLLIKISKHTKEVNQRLINQGDLGEYISRLNSVDLRVALRILKDAGNHNATEYLNEIDVPVLVMGGKEDTFTPPQSSALMASKIPQSELVMVPGGTHSLPIEQPDLVNLLVKQFLKNNLENGTI